MKLTQIAQQMRQYALQNPSWASDSTPTSGHTKRLSGGLIISLWVNYWNWNLLIKRVDVQPSITELETCVRDFRVPMAKADISNYRHQEKGKTYHWIKLSWPHGLDPTPVKEKPATGYQQRSLLEE